MNMSLFLHHQLKRLHGASVNASVNLVCTLRRRNGLQVHAFWNFRSGVADSLRGILLRSGVFRGMGHTFRNLVLSSGLDISFWGSFLFYFALSTRKDERVLNDIAKYYFLDHSIRFYGSTKLRSGISGLSFSFKRILTIDVQGNSSDGDRPSSRQSIIISTMASRRGPNVNFSQRFSFDTLGAITT